MASTRNLYKHLFLKNTAVSEQFTPFVGGNSKNIPLQDRPLQGGRLLKRFDELQTEMDQAYSKQESAGMDKGFGLQLEVESFPDVDLAFESLARERYGIELLNVKIGKNQTTATIFVPDGKLHILENLVKDYLDESKDKEKDGRKIPINQKLIDAIKNIKSATLEALWTDDPEAYPQSENEMFWWEVWLPVREDRQGVAGQFTSLATRSAFRIAKGEIWFPERTVKYIFGSPKMMKESILVLNSIAELRRGKETTDFFNTLDFSEQQEWTEELLQRANFYSEGEDTPYVCILDTGVNNGHPLLENSLNNKDLHSIEPAWETNDDQGHGTEMAGLVLLGDLTQLLDSNGSVHVKHRLESVKLLDNYHISKPELYGYLTTQAISRPEITAPNRLRIFCMAITTIDGCVRGMPSAWSATIDQLAFSPESQKDKKRLFLLSAGNVRDHWENYPYINTTTSICDPSQAWNALTVGACTHLVHITEPNCDNFQPIASTGELSPYSTTSQTWTKDSSFKPDVVFEGGNAAKDSISAVTLPSLSLLTTNSEMTERLYSVTNATSAATGIAARMAARLMAEYPKYRVETIRGLMVHSAQWTKEMCKQFLPQNSRPKKKDIVKLIRHCGFGEPDLERALWSVENSLTLICEDSLSPFIKEGSSGPKLKDMNLHKLPWPEEELRNLGETEVELRVTVSYFIEPSPSARGVKSRYCYESHGLRYDIQRPEESVDEFRHRINKAARDAENGSDNTSGDDKWLVGKNSRHKGSVHSDIWKGTAAELSNRTSIAVYPVGGWWKTRPKLNRHNQPADYSLIISIHAPDIDVKLYTAIENQIKIPIEV